MRAGNIYWQKWHNFWEFPLNASMVLYTSEHMKVMKGVSDAVRPTSTLYEAHWLWVRSQHEITSGFYVLV